MKIVHIITRFLRAGSEENTIGSCLDQVRRGYHVTLLHGRESLPAVVSDAAKHFNVIGVNTLEHQIDPIRDVTAFWEIRSILRRLRPDVVHTHQSKAGIVGRLAARAARVPAVVHTVHIAPFLNVSWPKEWLYVGAERAVAPFTDAIIDVSEGMRRAYLDRGIGRSADHRVVRSGMDISSFRNATAPLNWRDRIGGWPTDQKPRIILYAAAFEARKRQQEFITALEPALRGRKDICVVFAGEGPLLGASRDLARGLGLDQLRFIGHDPRFAELVALSDVCVLTSEREGLPRVVIQYIAAGKPVVIAHLDGIEEVLTHGRNALVLHDPGCVANAAAAAIDLCDDEDARDRLAAGARATDVTAWDDRVATEAIAAVYQAVLYRRGSESRVH